MAEQTQLIAAAAAYYEQGLNVVPEKLTYDPAKIKWDKMPLVPWRDWDNRRQTIEEFRALDWTNANAFAVVLGQQTVDGLFLAVIDFDVKGEVPEDVKSKGKEILKQFPITLTEKTVSEGLHLIYYSRQKPKTEAAFHD